MNYQELFFCLIFFLSSHIPTYEAESWMKAAEKVTWELETKG